MSPSNLTGYTSIPENSAATPGLFDSRFNVLHGNVTQVNNDLSIISTSVSNLSVVVSSVSGSGISGYRDVTLVRYGGAIGDGATNDATAFISGNSSTATQAVLYVPSAASVYRIASSVTISGTYAPIRGAILRPTSGTTVYIAGSIDAGPYQIFDYSAGGAFDFSNNSQIHEFDARWFGVKGNSTNGTDGTDDAPTIKKLLDALPNLSTVHFAPYMKMRMGSTVAIGGKTGIRIRGTAHGVGDSGTPGAPTFYDNTPSGSSALFFWVRCSKMITDGIVFEMRHAPATIESDDLKVITTSQRTTTYPNPAVGYRVVNTDTGNIEQYAGSGVWFSLCSIKVPFSGIGTACRWIRCSFNGDSTNTNLQALSISRYGDTNQEYHVIEDCGFVNFSVGGTTDVDIWGYIDNTPALGGKMSKNSSILTFDTGSAGRNTGHSPGFQRVVGERVVVAGAGAGGGALTSRISTIVDNYTFVLADTSSSTATDAWTIVGTNVGDAIFVGPSSNAKGIKIRDCTIVGWNVGVRSNGGSIHLRDNSFTANEQNIRCVGAQTEPSSELFTNTEQSRQHLYLDSEWPYTLSTGRLSSDGQLPSSGMLQFAAQAAGLSLTGTNIGVEARNTGALALDLTAAASLTANMDSDVCFGQSMAKLGLTTRHPSCTVIFRGTQNWLIGTSGETSVPAFGIYAGQQSTIRLDVSTGVTPGLVLALNANTPPDNLFDQGGTTMPYYNASNHQIKWKTKYDDGSTWIHGLSTPGQFSMSTSGVAMAPDFTQGDYQRAIMDGNHTIWVPAVSPPNGHLSTFEILNNTVGAITTAWNAAYLLEPWTDPAAGKRRTISFRYNGTIYVQDGKPTGDL